MAAVGSLTLGLTFLTWFPTPLSGRTLPSGIAATEARTVSIRGPWLVAKAPTGSLQATHQGLRARRNVSLRPMAICAPIRFTAIALTWNQSGGGTIGASIQAGWDLRHWGPDLAAGSAGDGPDRGSPDSLTGRTGTDLVWVGAAECARIELTLPGNAEVSDMRALFINTEGTAEGGAPRPERGFGARALLGVMSAEAMTRQPGIITRAMWGAKERYRNCGPYYSPRVKMAFVHHTANANSYSRSQSAGIMRAIYWYHTKGLGWCDIAYNFLVDKYGQVFEGRYGGMTKPVQPGATKGFNTGSVAVSAIGNYQIARPTSALIRSIERVLAWRLDWAHVDPSASVWMMSRGSTGNKYPPGQWVRFRTIAGHRNAGYTSCPGKYLYAHMATIRSAVYKMGLPKIFNPKQSPSSFITGQGSVTWEAIASARMKWNLQVLDASDQLVRGWNRWGSTFSLAWDGLTRQGDPVPPGIYRVVLRAWNSTGQARPAEFVLSIVPIPPCPSPPSASSSPSPSPSPCPTPTPSPSASSSAGSP
jgi:N-acetylmuramoyl-L-alanine amidase-like protein